MPKSVSFTATRSPSFFGEGVFRSPFDEDCERGCGETEGTGVGVSPSRSEEVPAGRCSTSTFSGFTSRCTTPDA